MLLIPLLFVPQGVALPPQAQRAEDWSRALVASEARLRAITAAVPDLLFVVDEDGRFVEV
ncbi:MAG: hypothetical protein HUU28_18810, partial [Planctomycetaceae bacterium]|nr:hypothetical protein [Planctomycetaceae bacterium]